ncbi:MAG: DEAD/DEAH box helicase [Alphaproteobacteria bacterium]
MTFEDLGLSPSLLEAVAACGYTQPTPIQEKAIPPILQGRDVLGCAQTGTGKTASYTLPMIDILDAGTAKARMPRALILAPTRELAQQIAASFETYGKNHKLSHAVVIGGEAMTEQERLLDRGVDVLIATPGRLLDLFERGAVMLGGVKVLVIDEADRMLDMGFIPDVERIVARLPKIRQTMMFSATLAPEIRRLADAFLINPKEVSVTPSATVAETVDHKIIRLPPSRKRDALLALLRAASYESALVFCNRKKDIGPLRSHLKKHGFDVGELHGDLPQSVRTETLAAFKSGKLKVIIASDVAGRGLDISKVSHVYNFDVPMNAEDYVHRIGRTGRAGRAGSAVTFVSPDDERYLDAIVKLIGRPVPEAPSPLDEGRKPAAAEAEAPAQESRPHDGHDAEAPARAKKERRPAPERKARRPAPEREARRPAPEREARREATPRPAGKRTAPSGSRNVDGPVVGMGDHVPDFLRLPVRRASAQGAK